LTARIARPSGESSMCRTASIARKMTVATTE
jgi:hypothetical protein